MPVDDPQKTNFRLLDRAGRYRIKFEGSVLDGNELKVAIDPFKNAVVLLNKNGSDCDLYGTSVVNPEIDDINNLPNEQWSELALSTGTTSYWDGQVRGWSGAWIDNATTGGADVYVYIAEWEEI